jgi:hypothetical protein
MLICCVFDYRMNKRLSEMWICLMQGETVASPGYLFRVHLEIIPVLGLSTNQCTASRTHLFDQLVQITVLSGECTPYPLITETPRQGISLILA